MMTKDELLTQALEKALIVLEKTGEFVVAETPILIQQLLTWNFVESVLYGTMLLIISLLLSIWPFFLWHFNNKKDWNLFIETLVIVPGVSYVIAILLAFPHTIYHYKEAVKIYIAPDLWLFEYAANLL